MDLIPRTSYAKDFIGAIKMHFYSNSDSNQDAMECADCFRDEEWKVIDDADYGENTRQDLLEMGKDDPELSSFINEFIDCMKYNMKMAEE